MTAAEAIHAAYQAGKSKRQTARELGISTRDLTELAAEAGIHWRSTRPGRMPTSIGRMRARVAELEVAHRQPLAVILHRMADDGHSALSAATELGLHRGYLERQSAQCGVVWPGRAEAVEHLRNKWHTANRERDYLLDLLKRINAKLSFGDLPGDLLTELDNTLETYNEQR